MSLFNGILGQVGSHADVGNLAAKLGIDETLAEKAIAALASAHQQPGDTVELAAKRTGLPTATVAHLIEQIGGEGSLGEFARMIAANPDKVSALLDRDGDGDALDDIAGFANGLFGRK